MATTTFRAGVFLGSFIALLQVLAGFPASAQEGADVSVDAWAVGDAVEAEITTGGESAEVHVVMSHEDPLSGTIVDRVATVPVSKGHTAQVVARDLPSGTTTVSLLEGSRTIPVLTNTTLVDSTSLGRIPVLDSVRVEVPIRDETHPHVFQGHPVTVQSGVDSAPVAVTSGGLVVASVVERQPQPGLGSPANSFQFALSRDGGHTFGSRVTVAEHVGQDLVAHDWALTQTENAFLMYKTYERLDGGGLRLTGARYAVFDLETESVLVDAPITSEEPFGRALDVARGTGADAWVAARTGSNISVWSWQADQELRLRAKIPLSSTETGAVGIANPAPNVVVVAWLDERSFANFTIRWSRSLDGGATFSAPAEVPEISPGLAWGEDLYMIADAAGTVHWSLLANPTGRVGDDPHDARDVARGVYLRLPLTASEPIVRWVNGTADAISSKPGVIRDPPLVLAKGSRVWLFFTHVVPVQDGGQSFSYAAESLDGGASFRPPFSTQNVHGWPILCPCGGDTFADGRPILSGYYAYDHNRGHPSLMPYFDPVPILETKTMHVYSGSVLVSPVVKNLGIISVPTPDRFETVIAPTQDGSKPVTSATPDRAIERSAGSVTLAAAVLGTMVALAIAAPKRRD